MLDSAQKMSFTAQGKVNFCCSLNAAQPCTHAMLVADNLPACCIPRIDSDLSRPSASLR